MCHPSSRYRSWEVCFVFFFVILVWTNDEIRIRSGEKHLASEPCQREGGAAISWCCCRRASQVGAPVLVLAWRRNLVTAAKREAGEFSIKNIFLLSFVFFLIVSIQFHSNSFKKYTIYQLTEFLIFFQQELWSQSNIDLFEGSEFSNWKKHGVGDTQSSEVRVGVRLG